MIGWKEEEERMIQCFVLFLRLMVLCPDQYLENGIWNTDFSIFGGGGVGGDRSLIEHTKSEGAPQS